MCVASIRYHQHGFTKNGPAFVALVERDLGSTTFGYNSQLDPDVRGQYLFGMSNCRHANNCFTEADQCKFAEECLQVFGSRDDVQDPDQAAYVTVMAFPYQVQQAAYAAFAEGAALDQNFRLSRADTPAPLPQAAPCNPAAVLLVPPLVREHIDNLNENESRIRESFANEGMRTVTIGGAPFLIACDDRLCMAESQLADTSYEIVTAFRASGLWEEIWRAHGTKRLALDQLQLLINRQVSNDGWSEEWGHKNYAPTPPPPPSSEPRS